MNIKHILIEVEGNSKIYCPEISHIAVIHDFWQYVKALGQLKLIVAWKQQSIYV